MSRLSISKTYKLYINGEFKRTESGRSIVIKNLKGEIVAHICNGSRKDFRDAVEVAKHASASWSELSPYLRGQILYRMAEMLEGRREEFISAIRVTGGGTYQQVSKEVDATLDRLIMFAGWADKYGQVLGCANSVSGPYYNFTTPQSQGVVGVLAPQAPSLLGLITMLAAPLCVGNSVVVLGSENHPLPSAILGEVCQTSDVPPGVINIINGSLKELLPHFAQHRDIASIYASGLSKKQRIVIETNASNNLTRFTYLQIPKKDWFDSKATASPWNLEPFVEMKTIWHPLSC